MPDLPPIPQGYSLTPPKQEDIPSPGITTVSPDQSLPPLPQGYSLTPPPRAADQPARWSGDVLPISEDTSGRLGLDFKAGLTGRLLRAFQSPGDVYTGATPILAPNGQPNPDLINRASDFAGFFSPLSAASRAGELVPGALSTTRAPTATELKAAGGAGYDAARAAGLDIGGSAVADMANEIRQMLHGEHGIIPETAPGTYGILDKLANPPSGGFSTVTGLEAARRGLRAVSSSSDVEGLAAGKAIGGIDNFLTSLDPSAVVSTGGDPAAVAAMLSDARGNYAAAQRSNDLTGTLDRATTGILDRAEGRTAASHSGRNLDNAIRQRVESFLEKPQNLAGFSQDEIDALNAVVRGGPVQDAARYFGNKLGGGGGLGSLIGMGLGGYAGTHVFGPEGGVIGAMAAPALGTSLKRLENALATRSLNSVDEMVRLRSPLAGAMQNQGLLSVPALDRNSAVLRALLPGLLSPQPPVLGGYTTSDDPAFNRRLPPGYI